MRKSLAWRGVSSQSDKKVQRIIRKARGSKTLLALSAAALAALQGWRAPSAYGASGNGTAEYFDVNGATAGFGTPTTGVSPNAYDMNGTWWDTSSAGTVTPGAFASNDQLTIGGPTGTDFSGDTFEINIDSGGNLSGIVVNSTNVTVTLIGTANTHNENTGETWSVATGSTLIEDSTHDGAYNFNSDATTFVGAGTITFLTNMGGNDNSTTALTDNMTGTVNLDWATNSGDYVFAGNYTQTAGTLNFETSVAGQTAFNTVAVGDFIALSGMSFDNTSGNASLILGAGNASYSIGGNITFVGSSNLNMGTAGMVLKAATSPTITVNNNTLTVGGVVSGTVGLTKAGAGTLALSGANSYSGSTTISAGTLQIGAGGSTGTLGTNAVTDNSVLVFNRSDAGLSVGNVISGSGTVQQIGAGTTTLTAAETYTGNTTVTTGTLALSSSTTNNLSSTNITVNSAGTLNVTGLSGGGITLVNSQVLSDNGHVTGTVTAGSGQLVTGTGTYNNNVTINSGAAITPGSASVIGTLSLSQGLSVNGTGVDEIKFLGASADDINVANAATFAGNSNLSIDLLSSPVAGSFVVLTAGSITGLTAGTLTALGRAIYSIDAAKLASNILQIDVTGGPANLTWLGSNATNPSNWDVNATQNWNDTTYAINPDVFQAYDNVNFDDTSTNGTVTIIGTAQVSSVTVNSNNTNYTFGGTGSIAGFGALTKLGTSTLTISTTNSYSGGTTINGGTLIANASAALGVGNATVNSGATLSLAAGNAAGTSNITVVGGTLDFGNATVGSGSLTINAGSSLDAPSGAVVVTSVNPETWAGSFTFLGTNNLTLGNGAVTLAASPTITVNNNVLTVGGNISGTTNSITKAGSGTLVLNGTGSNYSGGVTVNAGTLQVTGTGGSGGLGKGNTVVNSGATLIAGGQDAFGFNATGTQLITINGGTVTDLAASSGYRATLPNLQFTGGTLSAASGNTGDASGNYSLNGEGGSDTVTVNSATSTSLINAAISFQTPTTINLVGGGTVTGGATPGVDMLVSGNIIQYTGTSQSLTLTGSGVLAYSGTNTYTGATTIGGKATLEIGVGGTTGNISAGSVTDSSILEFNRSDAALSVGNVISGTGVVNQIGAGTTTLTGSDTYTGNTNVNAGTLALSTATTNNITSSSNINVGSSGTFSVGGVTGAGGFALAANQTLFDNGHVTGAVTASNSGAIIAGTGTYNNNVTVGSGGIITPNSTSAIGTMSIGGNLSVTGMGEYEIKFLGSSADDISVTGTANFAGDSSLLIDQLNGSPTIQNYVVLTGSTITGLTAGYLTQFNRTIYSIDATALASNILQIDISGGASANLIWIGNNASHPSKWDVNTTTNWNNTSNESLTPDVFYQADNVTFDDSSSNPLVNVQGSIQPGSITVNTSVNSYNFFNSGGTGSIDGTTTLTKLGNTTLTLNTAGTYSGATTINGGAIQLGNATVAQNSTVIPNVNNGLTFSTGITNFTIGGLSGSGSILLDDTGGNGVVLSVSNNGATTTYSGVLSDNTTGSGSLTKVGSGTFIVTGANTYNGSTTVSAGILQIGNGGAAGSISSSTITDNSTVAYDLNYNATAATLTGAGGLVQMGTGTTLTLNTTQSYNATTINPNTTVQVDSGGTLGTLGTGNVTDNGTLIFDRSDTAYVTSDVISGTGSVVQNGGGVNGTGGVTLSGLSTYTGNTNINNGTITIGATQVGTSSALGSLTGSGSVNITPGGALNLGNLAANLLNFGTKQFYVQGTGVNGTGAIINTGASQFSTFGQITLTGNATFNTTGRFDLRSSTPTLNLGAFTLTKIGTGQFSLQGANVTGTGTILEVAGVTSFETTATIPSTVSVHILDGTTQQFYTTANNTLNVTAPFTIGTGGAAGVGVTMGADNADSANLGSNILLEDNLTLQQQNANAADTLLLNGIISDDFATSGLHRTITVNANGTGVQTYIFAGANNTYTGATIINGGVLEVVSDADLGAVPSSPTAGNIVIGGGATLEASGSFISTNRGIALNNTTGNSTIALGSESILTYAGIIADGANAGGILGVSAGTGTLYLTGNNTYTGNTNVIGGTLQLAAGTNILYNNNPTNNAQINLGASAILELGDASGPSNQTFGNLNSSGANATTSVVGGNAAVSTLTLDGNYGTSAAPQTFSHLIGGTGTNQNNVAFDYTGSGFFKLNFNNTYTGGTVINASGTLIAGQTGAFGNVSGNVTLDAGTLDIQASSTSSPYIVVIPGTIPTGGVNINSDVPTSGAGSTQSLGNLNLPGNLTNSTNGILLNFNPGINVTSGNATVAFGAVTLTDASTGISTLDPNASGSINGVVTATTVTGSATSGQVDTLDLNGTSTGNNTISSVISDGTSGGQVAVIKRAVGTWILSGNNTYSGGTIVNNGSLVVNGGLNASNSVNIHGGTLSGVTPVGQSLGNVTIDTAVTSSATISPGNITNPEGTLTMSSLNVNAGNLSFTLGSVAGSSSEIAVSGNANFTGGTITFGNTPSATGTYLLLTAGNNLNSMAGSVTFSPKSNLLFTYTLDFGDSLNNGANPDDIFVDVGNNIPLLVWDGDSSSTWDKAAGNWNYQNIPTTVYADPDGVVFDDTNTNGTNITLNIAVAPTLLTVNSNNNNYTISGTGSINDGIYGSTSLVKQGSSTLIIATTNNYTGGTVISGGTVQMGNGGTAGSLGTGPITDNGVLATDLSSNFIFSNYISGSGSFVQNGTGTVTFDTTIGAYNYSGNTTVNSGEIQLNQSTILGNASGPGSGTVVLNGNNSSGLAFSTGVTNFTLAGLAGSGSLILEDTGGTAINLTIGENSASTIYSGAMSDGGATNSANLTKVGTGTLTLAGQNSFNGTTTINSGGLLLDNQNALQNSTVISAFAIGTAPAGTSPGLQFAGGVGSFTLGGLTSNTYGITLADTASQGINLAIGNNGSSSTLSGIISDGGFTGSLTKLGSGTLTLTGVNTYTGNTNIANGIVTFGTNTAATALGSVTGGGVVNITAGGELNLSPTGSSSLNFGTKLFAIAGTGVNGAGAIVNTGTQQENVLGNFILTGNATVNATARIDFFRTTTGGTGNLNGFTLTKIGAGQLSLTDAGFNTIYGGNIVVAQGLLSVEGNTSIPTSFNGSTTPTTITYLDGSSGGFYASSGTVTAAITVGNNSSTQTAGVALGGDQNNGTGSIGSNIALEDNLTIEGTSTAGTGTNSATFIVLGNITDGGTDAGTPWTLTTAATAGTTLTILAGTNTYSGTTTINANSTLQIGNGGSTGTLGTGTLGQVSGSNVVDNGTLTFDRGDNALVVANTITNTTTGVGVINQVGTGSTTLSGGVAFSGNINVSAGTLVISGSLTDGGTVNVNTGGTMSVTGTTGPGYTVNVNGGSLNGSTTLVGANNTDGLVNLVSGTITPGSAANPQGTLNMATLTTTGGTLLFNLAAGNASSLINVNGQNGSASGIYTGTATISANTSITIGTAAVGSFELLTSLTLAGSEPTQLNLPNGFGGNLNYDPGGDNDIFLNVFAVPISNLVWDGHQDNTTWDINTTANWNNGSIPNADYTNSSNVTFNDTAPTTATTIALNTTVTPVSVTFNNSVNNYVITGTGAISGSTALVMNGSATTTINTINSYTGGTTVNAGTLVIGAGIGANSGLGKGNVTVNVGATLVGGGTDAFGYFPGNAPAQININGGTVTDLAATTGYHITMPNLNFTGGTLTSNSGNTGVSGGGEYSLFGNTPGGGAVVTTNATSSTAVINAASVSLQNNNTNNINTIFNVAGGVGTTLTDPNVTSGTFGVDLLVASNLIQFETQTDGITLTGSGVMALTGTNTYTGNTTISSGTLQIGTGGSTGTLGTGAVINNSNMVFNRGDTGLIVGNVISGSGVVYQNGTGMTTLTGGNTFSGGVFVNAGNLEVTGGGGGTGLGSGNTTVNAGGTLIGGGTDAFGYFPHNAPAQININGGIVTDLASTTGYRVTLPNLNFTGGTLTSNSGNSGNGGQFSLFGNTPAGGAVVTTNATSSTAVMNAGSISLQNNTTSNLNTIFNVAGGAGTTLTDPNVTSGTPGVDLLIASNLIKFNSQTDGVTLTGSGVLAFTGTNAYTGNTTISSGTLQIGTGGSTGTLGAGVVIDNSNMVFNRSDAGLTVANTISGSGAVYQNGVGTTTLSGTNTYSGGTIINHGTLSLTGTLNSAGTVNVNNGGTLTGSTSVANAAGNVTVFSGGIATPGIGGSTTETLNLTSLTVSGGELLYSDLGANNASSLFAVSGNANFSGNTTLSLAAAVAGSFLLLTAGSLTGNAPTLIGVPGGLTPNEEFNPGGDGDLILILSAASNGPASLTWDGHVNGAWDINTTANWNNGTNPASVYTDGSNVTFDDTNTGATSITLNTTVNPLSVTVNSSTNSYTFTGNGSIAGSTSLVKSGASTLIVATSNSYTGGTAINAGTVQVGNGGSLGSLGSGNVTDNAALAFDRGDAGFTFANNISGSGTVTQSGTGTTTLTGSNSYSGNTTVSAGTLAIGAAGALPSGGNVIDNANLAIDANSVAGNVSGGGTTTVASSTTFSAANFGQGALVNNGTTTILGNGTVGSISGSGGLVIGNGSTSNTLTVHQPGGASTQSALTINNGAELNMGNNELTLNTTTAGALQIGSTGTLNLNGEMIVNYAPGQDPVTTIRGYLASGFNGGSWNGPGIISTDAQTLTNGLSYALGFADYASEPVTGFVAGLSSGQIEVKYTLVGDLNLNGFVDGVDFSILGHNFNKFDTNWTDGNMLYHSLINGQDFSVFAKNFGRTAVGGSITLSAADWAAFDAFEANEGVAVPEPTSMGLLALGGAGLLARRRRRKGN